MALIRLSRSVVGKEESEAVARVIETGFLGMGQEVLSFEQEIQRFLETDRSVVCVNTGTAALHLALEALDIGPGDEVLVPSITYVASFQAIAATGARPVACDVQPEDVFLSMRDAERRLTPNTRAIMPVHYASNSSRLDDVYTFALKHGLRVVEDAAHSFGCLWNGGKVGSQGDIVCFSFDGIKNITSGEGGAIVTADAVVAERIRDARLLGVEKDSERRFAGERSWQFDVKHRGFRCHMSNIMGAIGREQLKKLPIFSKRRKALATRYKNELSGLQGLKHIEFSHLPEVPHVFVVRVLSGLRGELLMRLKEEEIEAGTPYAPNHLLSLFKTKYRLPISEQLGEELVSLPLHPLVSDKQQTKVIQVIRTFLQGSANA